MRQSSKLAVVIVVTFIVGCSSDGSHRKAATELVEVANIRSQIEKYRNDLERTYPEIVPRLIENNFTQEYANAYVTKIKAIVDRDINYDKLKIKYIDMYMETFTETELKNIISFYKSDAGQKYIINLTKIVDRSSQIMDSETMKIMRENDPIKDKP